MLSPLHQTERLEDLIARQPPDLPLVEKILRIDLIACQTLEDELVNQGEDLRWFFGLMVTLLDYYLFLLPGLEAKLLEIPSDKVKPVSTLKELAQHHLYRHRTSTLVNSRHSDYYQQARNYLKLRKELRSIVQEWLITMAG